MPEWRGQSRGNKLGYRIFVTICKNVGLGPAYFLLRFVAFYFFLFSWKTSSILYDYFRKRIGHGQLRAIMNVYTNYYRFGQTLLDRIVVMSGMDSGFTYHFDGEGNLLEIVERGSGGILLSGHIGNWELAGHFLHRLNTNVHVVMFEGEHQQIKDYLDQVTGRPRFNVIPLRDDLSHVYAIGQALQRNEVVCMHADRYLEGGKVASEEFMGDQALFPLGPFVLASTFNVPVSIVFAFKETTRHYHLFGSEPLDKHEGESKQEYIARLMNTFVKKFERSLEMYPEQWFNYYDFWARPVKA